MVRSALWRQTSVDSEPEALATTMLGHSRISLSKRHWPPARVAAVREANGVCASVVPLYCTLPAEFSRITLESTAVSDWSGKCEQKPMPT